MLRFVFTLVCLCLAHPVLALCSGPAFTEMLTEAERAELSAMAADTPYGEGLLWQAEKDGTDLTIIGTMHLPDDRLAPLADQVAPYLSQAEIVLVEATLEDQAAIQRHLAENPDLITLTSGGSLIDRLEPTVWAAVAEAAEARGIPGFMAARMQPWFLTMSLSMPPCALSAMQQGTGGLDNILLRATPDTAEIRALEGWRDMLDLLRMGSFEEQIDALRLGLVDPDLQDAMVVSMLNSYFDRNPAASWHLTRFSARFIPGLDQATFDAQFAEMEELLLTGRNRNWIPVIEEAAGEADTIFIAFGAAHLVGEDGVLALLENRGWQITRLD